MSIEMATGNVLSKEHQDAAVELANWISDTILDWQKRHPNAPDDLAPSVVAMIAEYGPMRVHGISMVKKPTTIN